MAILSKIISYIFALVVIFTTGNIIFSIAVGQDKVPEGDWLLIFCLLLIMLMGIYYIVNDIKSLRAKNIEPLYEDEGVLDEELVSK